jgi:hypothetical protein
MSGLARRRWYISAIACRMASTAIGWERVEANTLSSSCPRLSRASTSYFITQTKTWMAGSSPAMTNIEIGDGL